MIRPFKSKDANICFQNIQNDINETVQWPADSNLVFNVKKIKFVIVNKSNDKISQSERDHPLTIHNM